ncbi:isochorismate synthase [Corticibacter populi]|nr:isochorismate synthase [Corticibacter populi]
MRATPGALPRTTLQREDAPLAARRSPDLSNCFMLHGAAQSLAATGVHKPLFQDSTHALTGCCDTVLGALDPDWAAAPLLVGAMPFDRDAPCWLYQPQTMHTIDSLLAPKAAGCAPAGGDSAQVQAVPDRRSYQDMVRQATARLGNGTAEALRKVVLARSLEISRTTPFDLRRLLRHLMNDASITTYCLPLPGPARHAAASHLVGATPELLITRRGKNIKSLPLAGSLPKQANPMLDQAATRRLLQSAKDLQEHRVVVEFIADLLNPLCANLAVPAHPSLCSTASMWHLGTHINGTLKHPDDLATSSSLALAARLQPTPALCGAPRDAALTLIRQLEPFERGFYGGTAGWSDNTGDGSWYVAIRCAEIQGPRARLFAGAGIMHDSSPAAEADETAAKFSAMLRALELEGLELFPTLGNTASR